jgi:hypothetical protein
MKLLKDLRQRQITGVVFIFGGTEQSFRLDLTTPRRSDDPVVEEVHGDIVITRKLTDKGAIVPLNAKRS